MASQQQRKFYYDWNEGKYRQSDENIRFFKEMDWKGHNHGYNIDKIRKAHEEQNNNNNENENVVKCSDNVDAGRGCVNHNKLNESKTLSELSKGHKVMMSVLSARLLRLTAAQTLWHKDMNSFIEYILRVEDNAVVVDILPILTKRVKNEGTELSTLSMGACLDLLPVLANLLESKYEDYIVASIDMIREVMKRWWKQLQLMGKKEKQELEVDHRCSRSVNGVYTLLISMTDRIRVLAKRSGRIGEKAKVLQELMALL